MLLVRACFEISCWTQLLARRSRFFARPTAVLSMSQPDGIYRNSSPACKQPLSVPVRIVAQVGTRFPPLGFWVPFEIVRRAWFA